jgi:Ankyrin repeat
MAGPPWVRLSDSPGEVRRRSGLGYSRAVRGDAMLMRFARAIVDGDQARVRGLLAGAPELALARLAVGATRHGAQEYFLDEIVHILYAGDTALHVAAAAWEAGIARELINAGASVAAANRRGAQPLHYAVDGIPGSARWNPHAQREAVPCLLEFGADPQRCSWRARRRAAAEAVRPRQRHNNSGSSDSCKPPAACE